jgi:hypothetical protein
MTAHTRNVAPDEHECPAYERCPDCGSMPLDMLHDSLRETLRKVAEDACGEQLTECVGDPLLNKRRAA